MPNATVRAAATGLPKPIIDRSAIEALPLDELYRVVSVLQGCADLLVYSTYSSVLGGLASRIVDEVDNIVCVAEKREPTTPNEAQWKGWLLAQHDAWVSTDITVLALKASRSAMRERELQAEQAVRA